MVDTIVILCAAHCVNVYFRSMLFIYCMKFSSTTVLDSS